MNIWFAFYAYGIFLIKKYCIMYSSLLFSDSFWKKQPQKTNIKYTNFYYTVQFSVNIGF